MKPVAHPRRAILVGVILVAASVGLLQFDRGPGGSAGAAGQLVSAAAAPFHRAAARAGRSARGFWEGYFALVGVQARVDGLEREVDRLRGDLAAADGLAAENRRLRALLDLAEARKDLRLRAARVVARGTTSYFRVAHLELAADGDGPQPEVGMPVLSPGGLVGRLRAVDGNRAEVMLLTDPRSAVDVMLERSGAQGVAIGAGHPDRYSAKLEYLDRDADARDDDRVLTSGGGDGRFPRGLLVGEVRLLEDHGGGPFRRAEVRPLVDFGRVEEVFVVLGESGLTPDGQALSERRRDQPEKDDR